MIQEKKKEWIIIKKEECKIILEITIDAILGIGKYIYTAEREIKNISGKKYI